jgi:DNA polymerase-3 subunit alpha
LAGYTLGAADLLRRAMGKKKPEEMAKQRAIFVAGAVKNGVAGEVATHIFDLMEKFAGYGFNKSHSAAYALLSYQTAWLKAHYPAEFMAAVLSSDMDNTDKVVSFYEDTLQQGCEILYPNINYSQYYFTVNNEDKIVYGLGAIKGVGQAAVEMIVENRSAKGPFKDLFEFCERIDLRKANKRVLEALIKSGALDDFGQDRQILLASMSKAVQLAEHAEQNADHGQADLFGHGHKAYNAPEYIQAAPFSEKERLDAERETLGLYLSGHPLDAYKNELNQIVTFKIKDFNLNSERSLRVAGLVTNVRVMNTKRGDRMAILTLDDKTASTEVAVFSELFQANRELLEKDKILIIEGDISIDRFTGNYRFNTRNILSLDQARAAYAKGLLLTLDPQQIQAIGFMEHLQGILERHKNGQCLVAIDYMNDGAAARLRLGDAWRVRLNDELLKELRIAFGEERVNIVYTRKG